MPFFNFQITDNLSLPIQTWLSFRYKSFVPFCTLPNKQLCFLSFPSLFYRCTFQKDSKGEKKTLQALSSARPSDVYWTPSTVKMSRQRAGWKASACWHISQCFAWLRVLLSQIGHECVLLLFFVWERLQSVLFINSLRLLYLINISLAAEQSGRAVWLSLNMLHVPLHQTGVLPLKEEKEKSWLNRWLNRFVLHFWIA